MHTLLTEFLLVGLGGALFTGTPAPPVESTLGAALIIGVSLGAWLLAVWVGYRIGQRLERPVETTS